MFYRDAKNNAKRAADLGKSGLIISARTRTCGRGEPLTMRGRICWVGAKSDEGGRPSLLFACARVRIFFAQKFPITGVNKRKREMNILVNKV